MESIPMDEDYDPSISEQDDIGDKPPNGIQIAKNNGHQGWSYILST
jgi:hypothetical protein